MVGFEGATSFDAFFLEHFVSKSSSISSSVVITGGGIIGSFVAYFLRCQGFSSPITVIERDNSYQFSSTALSAASIRTQFGCDFNVKMSLFAAQMFRDIKKWFGEDADIGFREHGYLIVGSRDSSAAMHRDAERQNANGANIESLTPDVIGTRYPWLNVEDVGAANFGLANEGWFDAWALLQLVRTAAKKMGVDYVAGEACAIEATAGRVTAVRLRDGTRVNTDWCVNAAGPASAKVAAFLDIDLPVRPRKRTVFHVKAPLTGTAIPMVFDSSGAWIRPEGEGYIAGIAPDADDDPDADGDFEPQHQLFEDSLWPKLAHRIPALDSLRVLRAWAGHYEMNLLDHNGVLGPHDRIANFLFATGFSGHGVMHSPAAGRAIAEHIMYGTYRSLDLTPLGYDRIRQHRPIVETVVY